MVSLGWFDELGESRGIGAPVEVSAVDYYAADCGAVASYPFCCAVDDDVGAVGYGSGEVASCSEGVVDLASPPASAI